MERRRTVRHVACFPVHLDVDEQSPALSVVRDMSVTGAKIYSRKRVDVGAPIHLKLYILGPEDARDVSGHVVRCVRRKQASTWPFEIAVEFDEPLVGFEVEIARVAEAQSRINATS